MFKNALKLSIFDRIIFRLNLVVALGLLLTYLAPYINPSAIGLIALFGLAYPFALVINMGFVAYWLLKRRVQILLSLVAILSGWPILTSSIALNFTPPPPMSEGFAPLKVMSYNVQNFDLYNWNENLESRDKMMELIKSENPDIVCFQEFYTEEEEKSEFHNVKLLVNDMGFKYHHFVKTLTLKNVHHWGLAIFSKYPITHKEKVNFANTKNNIIAVADIDVNGQMVRLFNTHLQSIHLGNKDLKYLNSIGVPANEEEAKKHLKSSKAIVTKLNEAYAKRSAQAQDLTYHIGKTPADYLAIVCGDFNDTPASFAYRTIAQGMKDAFLEVGLGTGGTYAGPLPSFRIDYVLLNPSIEVGDFKIIPQKYSDHYPVSCVLHLPVKEKKNEEKDLTSDL